MLNTSTASGDSLQAKPTNQPMNVSSITRTLNHNIANAAYKGVCPDIVRTCAVPPGPNSHLISRDPLTAGTELHALLGRIADNDPLSPKEKAYLPFMATLRTMVRDVGAAHMDSETDLPAAGTIPGGACDLLVRGGPQRRGVVEVKVLMHGTQKAPRGRDLAQVGAYARLIARRGSFDHVWAAVAYVELETGLVRFYGFTNSRQLVMRTLQLVGTN
jgi:hypothetical protein